MTAKSKATADDDTADEPVKVDERRLCGAPHYLPVLAHVTCLLPAQDPDCAPGAPDHEHRHEDGDTIYVW